MSYDHTKVHTYTAAVHIRDSLKDYMYLFTIYTLFYFTKMFQIIVYIGLFSTICTIFFKWFGYTSNLTTSTFYDLSAHKAKKQAKFTTLPLELLMKIMESLDIEDLISFDGVGFRSKGPLRTYLLKAMQAMNTSFWRRQRITNKRDLNFIIHRKLLTRHKDEVLPIILKVDLTATAADKHESSLHYAVRNGCFEIVRWLIRHYGIDVNQTDSRGRCSLTLCCLSSEQRLPR